MIPILSRRLALVMVPLLLAGCQSPSASARFDLAAVKTAIALSNHAFEDAVARQDSAGVVACYSPDACLYPPNTTAQCGVEAIRGFVQGTLASGVRGVTLRSTEVTGGPEGVAEVGTYTLRNAAGTVVDQGNYIVLWSSVGGRWLMHRDVFSSERSVTAR